MVIFHLYKKSENLSKQDLLIKVARKTKEELKKTFWYKGYKCEVKPGFIKRGLILNTVMYIPGCFNGYIWFKNDKKVFWNVDVWYGWTYDRKGVLGYDHAHINDVTLFGRVVKSENELCAFSSMEYVISEVKCAVDEVLLRKSQQEQIKKSFMNTDIRDLTGLVISFIVGVDEGDYF